MEKMTTHFDPMFAEKILVIVRYSTLLCLWVKYVEAFLSDVYTVLLFHSYLGSCWDGSTKRCYGHLVFENKKDSVYI